MATSETPPSVNGSKKRKATDGTDDDNDGVSTNNHNDGNNSNTNGGGEGTTCPYLDTVQRSLLDFDFEPSCSVSLESGPHVYGCLVCGKYFRGRGRQTPAYTHSVDEGHFVFVHLSKGTFYCLPDGYEIKDPSLSDISATLHPTYTAEEVRSIDSNAGLARDLFGRRYLPGFVGLNNLNKTDYINSTVQALAHVRPLRDYFLRLSHRDVFVVVPTTTGRDGITGKKTSTKTASSSSLSKPPHRMSDVAYCFGELVRKLWSDRRFKSHVDPHMLVQAIGRASKKKFRLGKQAEVGEFMAWFLHQLHVGLGGTRKPKSSIVYRTFQGVVEVTTRQRKIGGPQQQQIPAEEITEGGELEEKQNDLTGDAADNHVGEAGMEIADPTAHQPTLFDDDMEETTVETTFLQLTLDIPEKPLFRDDEGGLVIPQEPLVSVMKKFDGMTFSEAINASGMPQKKRYRLRELPPYLILHLARFKTNNYSKEKNPTIVAFPVKNLDLSPYTFPKEGKKGDGKARMVPPTEKQIRAMSVGELRALLKSHGREDIANHAVEKDDLVQSTVDFVCKSLPDLLADKYDLVANVTHDSPADVGREGKTDPLQEGSYKCHVHHRASNHWYEIQDLHVQETMPQLIGVSESYLLIFERKSAQHMDLS